MIKEAIGFGATIDEAKENAIAQLGASEMDDVQFEVIAMQKKKVLGIFGGSDAQVRAYIEIPEKKEKVNKRNAAKAKTVKEKPVKRVEEKPAEPKVNPVTAEKTATKKVVREVAEYGEPVDEKEISAESPAGKAIAYIKPVLSAVGCENTSVKVAQREGASLITLDGEDLNIIIGRRGETLDALQYLASLAANNSSEGRYRISVNVGNYRERREETLISLANRISAQVLKSGKSRTLEPMNPYERRIIHTAVQNIDGVVSNSFGDGTGRRVVISIEGAEVKPPRINDNRRRSGRPQGSRPKQTVADSPAREPKRDSDMPLYGKIN